MGDLQRVTTCLLIWFLWGMIVGLIRVAFFIQYILKIKLIDFLGDFLSYSLMHHILRTQHEENNKKSKCSIGSMFFREVQLREIIIIDEYTGVAEEEDPSDFDVIKKLGYIDEKDGVRFDGNETTPAFSKTQHML
ncbi:hypothetical protein ACJX0J_040532 [Zea mays]